MKKAERKAETSKPTIVVQDPEDASPTDEHALNETILQSGDRLFVMTHGGYLCSSDDSLIVKKRKQEISRTPLDKIGLVFLQGLGMNVAVSLQLQLAERDIPMVFAPPVGLPIAVLNPIQSSRSYLRVQQVLRRDDPDIVATALSMLAAKIGNQAAVLSYFAKYRKKTTPPLADDLKRSAGEIRKLAANLQTLDISIEKLRTVAMGYEGHAAAIYWQSISRLVPEDLDFSGRITRNAGDVVNQCINYAYGILYGEVWRALVKAGLDPYFGLMHGSQRDQGSLVFDLIEEFRAPFADRVIIGMIGRKFRPQINPQGLLRTRTRRQLALAFSKHWNQTIRWRSAMVSPAEILDQQAVSLVKLIRREGTYHPFRMRW